MKKMLIVSIVALFVCSSLCSAGENATKEECIEMCQKASKLIEDEGLDSALSKMNDSKGPFVWKNSYMFCIDDKKAKMLAHPFFPRRLIGQDFIENVDLRGKRFFRDFIKIANAQGQGWSKYVFWDAKNGAAKFKHTYLLKLESKNIILGAGILEDKMDVAIPRYDIPEDMVLPKIEPKKVAMIVAPKTFNDDQFYILKKIVEQSGGVVETFSQEKGAARGMYGNEIEINRTTDEIRTADFDAVAFVGGPGVYVYFNNPAIHKIAREAAGQNKVLGAIGWAPVIFANAGVLEKKTVTVHPFEAGWFRSKGYNYTGDSVAIDSKMITANNTPSTAQFGISLIELLN